MTRWITESCIVSPMVLAEWREPVDTPRTLIEPEMDAAFFVRAIGKHSSSAPSRHADEVYVGCGTSHSPPVHFAGTLHLNAGRMATRCE